MKLGVCIYGQEVESKVGSLILVDGWGSNISQALQPCEFPDFAQFRLPSGRYDKVAYAVNIEVTGRTTQSRPWNGRGWVRIKITFVGDGEPDSVVPGWMKI
jgi:hypothetical protein